MKLSIFLTVILGACSFAHGFLIGPPPFTAVAFYALLVGCAVCVFSLLLAVVRRQWKKVRFMSIPLGVVLAMTLLSFPYQRGQVEAARIAGDTIIERAVAYNDVNGKLPSALLDLAEFDSIAIPSTGMGFWDLGEQKFEWTSIGMLSFRGFGGNLHMSVGSEGWTSTEEFLQDFSNMESTGVQ